MIDFKKIITLTDRGNIPCAPLTLAKAVYLTNGETVENSINAALPQATYESNNKLSTVEHFTGEYDLDGKKIYKKTLVITTMLSGGKISLFAHGISNVKSIWVDTANSIAARGTTLTDYSTTINFGAAYPGSSYYPNENYRFEGNVSTSQLLIFVGPSTTYLGARIVLKYTCTDR